MEYQIKEINTKEYEEFNQQLNYYSLFQTSEFTKSREFNYQSTKILGCYIDNKLIATTQLLIEPIPYINKKMGTSIKGPNIDFDNQEYLNVFNKALKKYLKENNILLMRFDLPIGYKTYDGDFKEATLDNDFTFLIDSKIKEKMANAQFHEFFIDENYMGRSPQYTMLVDLKSEENIKKQMNRSVKRAIKTAKNYEMQIKCYDNVFEKSKNGEEYLKIFYKLHKSNADISNVQVMEYEYYESLFKNSNNLKLFLVSYKPNQLYNIIAEEISKKSTPKKEKLLEIISKQKDEEEVYIIGHIAGFYNKIGYDLFTGLDYDYRDLGAKEALMEYIFNYANEKDMEYYDFWGILGKIDKNNHMYNVYKFKRKFSNIIVQYPGFWDVYTNKLLYKIFTQYQKLKYIKKEK